MKISFKSPFLSINSFPEIEVPDFCVITGVNGSGKSHLLKAIVNGSVLLDDVQNIPNQNQIRMFDWSSLVPKDTNAFGSEQLRTEIVNLFTNYNQKIDELKIPMQLQSILIKNSLPPQYINNPLEAIPLSLDEIKNICPEEKAEDAFREIQDFNLSATTRLYAKLGESASDTIRAVTDISGRPTMALSQTDFLSAGVPGWGRADLFQQSFAHLFVAYRDLRLSNEFRQFRASRGHSGNFLTDSEFLERHGPPPWEFVNESLAATNLGFKIDHPDLDDYIPYKPEITKLSTGIRMSFSSLSSGEKILMSVAFCIYYSNDS